MALFDIFEEITARGAVKTELGEKRIFGAVIGIVAENYSKEMPGRLCVNIPTRDENANQLKWAKTAFPYMGGSYGAYFLPEKGDQVVLVFEDGNIEKPFVVGCIPRDNDAYLKKNASEKNLKKQIQTRNGSRLAFEEDENEDGMKDKITLSTAGDRQQVILNNEKNTITICDAEKNSQIVMEAGKGKIVVHAEKKMEITVGDSITVTLNGSSGTIKIEAQNINMETGKSLSLCTDGNAKLSGRQTAVEAAASLKASSSGMVLLEGKPIKLG